LFRRLVVMLVVGVGLLGIIQPALACATARDCCPTGPPSPCDGVRAGDAAFSEINLPCCAAHLGSGVAVSIDRTRVRFALAHSQGSPDPVFLLASIQMRHPAFVGPADPKSASSYLNNASLTYLRTARLRL
jgi:hypothetical protein